MQLDWNNEKNALLKKERQICFEDIAVALEQGGLVEMADHPNQAKYPNQKIMFVKFDNYIYMVPCIKTVKGWFLKTIFPSRKATNFYLNEGDNSHESN
ncbi:MAG: toxin [Candidatus Omnitrophica bacterium]|nr:toxin [Candidatus Omnitrophota bacterium]MDE2222719.1 toxin [Candidatus Omnitrophota bacterium]